MKTSNSIIYENPLSKGLSVSLETQMLKEISIMYTAIINSEYMQDFYSDYIEVISKKLLNIKEMTLIDKTCLYSELRRVIELEDIKINL